MGFFLRAVFAAGVFWPLEGGKVLDRDFKNVVGKTVTPQKGSL